MRKHGFLILHGLLLTVAAVLLPTACSDFHTSDNGALDGFWQLTHVDTLSTKRSGDVRDRKIFWAVQAGLLEMCDMTNVHFSVFFRFEHQGDELRLSHPVVDNRLVSDSLVNDVNTIRHYGMSRMDETLKVLMLDNKKMVLESAHFRMRFRKY